MSRIEYGREQPGDDVFSISGDDPVEERRNA
jgi:hypothetical protein